MITIKHTRAEGTLIEGTLIEGSAKGDGVYEILKGLGGNWRYFPSLRQIGIGQSRDKAAQTWRINAAADALRNAGHDVTIEIDDTEARSFAEAEAERYERAEARADRMAGYAANAAARSAAGFATAQQIADMIPMGQPILVGHHSERRHRKDLERIDRGMRAGVDEGRKAEHYEHRAAVAADTRASREDVPTTLRRIKKLEADERRMKGSLLGRPEYYQEDGAWKCRLVKPEGDYKTRLETELASVREQLAYWRDHVKAAEASGVKIWSRADFTKGDFARRRGQWVEVIRVNAKSLTVPAWLDVRPVATRDGQQYSWTDTLPYDEVRGRKSAEEMSEILAEVKRREAASA